MATACTIEDMYKNFQILADAKEKAGEVTVETCGVSFDMLQTYFQQWPFHQWCFVVEIVSALNIISIAKIVFVRILSLQVIEEQEEIFIVLFPFSATLNLHTHCMQLKPTDTT